MARIGRSIYLDMNALTQPRVTGIGKYCIELFHALQAHTEVSSQEYILKPTIKLSRAKHMAKVKSRIGQKPKILGISDFFDGSEKIYHGLDFRVPHSKRYKKVVTIHDLISFEQVFNEQKFIDEAKINFESMLYQGEPDVFICISEFTRQKFIDSYPKFAAQTRVVPLGCNHHVKLHEEDRSSLIKKAVLPNRFILSLGTIEFRKNTIMAVKAFEKLASKFADLHLVIAGSKGFRGEETLRAMEMSPFRDRIHHLNYVSDSLVDLLYQRAEAFIFPSLFEGFGLPILEAMKRGCPVVTSKGGATEEVAGEGAVLVDPQNVDETATAIHDILTQSDLRQSVINLGWNRCQQFTWEKSAFSTLEIYKNL